MNREEISTNIRNKIMAIIEEHCSTTKKQFVAKKPNVVRVKLRDWEYSWDRENYQLDKTLPVLAILIEQSVADQIDKFFKEMLVVDLPLIWKKGWNLYRHSEETHDGVSWHDCDNSFYEYKFSWDENAD